MNEFEWDKKLKIHTTGSRVGFFLGYELGCCTVGVEYDERIFRQAMENKAGVSKKP